MTLTARSMEDAERYRQIRRELFCDFKESAVGMMENIQEAEHAAGQRWAKVAEDIQRELEAHRRG